MRLTKSQLKQIIKEELQEGAWNPASPQTFDSPGDGYATLIHWAKGAIGYLEQRDTGDRTGLEADIEMLKDDLTALMAKAKALYDETV